MSDSVLPHRRQPTRLPHPWDSPGKNTGVGCHFLLQCMKVKNESEVAQSCPTLSDPMDYSPPGSSIHGIFQARVLEWGAIAFSWEQSRALDFPLLQLVAFLGGASGKEPACQCRRHEFDPWVRKICWRREWQPTPVFLSGKPHGPRSLAGYSPRVAKNRTWLKRRSAHAWCKIYLL